MAFVKPPVEWIFTDQVHYVMYFQSKKALDTALSVSVRLPNYHPTFVNAISLELFVRLH